jgi:colicin import membrane protein
MSERPSDRWISLFWSVLLHGGLIALLAYGFWNWDRPKPQPVVAAIDAMVVDSKTLSAIPAARRAPPEPAPKPPEPAPEPTPPAEPPKPSPEEIAQQKEQEQQEQQQKKEAEEKKLADQARLAEDKRIADEKADADRKEQAEAERKAAADAAKKQEADRKLAEQKKQDDLKRQAEEKRKAEEAKQEADRQAELQRSLEAEEKRNALLSSGAMASWIQQITARITRAWIRPQSARAGIDCTLLVTQVPGGEVVSVRVTSCNGDQAVRESIEAAAYRASPLPPPPDPAMFDRNLEIRFRPVD